MGLRFGVCDSIKWPKKDDTLMAMCGNRESPRVASLQRENESGRKEKVLGTDVSEQQHLPGQERKPTETLACYLFPLC